MYEWMVIIAFVGTAEVIYSYLRMRSWLDQIDSFKDELLYEAKLEIERAELIKRFEPSPPKNDTKSKKWRITS
jgi:hypothetical protein